LKALDFALYSAWMSSMHIPDIVDVSLIKQGYYDESALLMQLALYRIMMVIIHDKHLSFITFSFRTQ